MSGKILMVMVVITVSWSVVAKEYELGEMVDDYGVCVRDFGAVGDGEADDTGPIQDALDSGAPLVGVPYGYYKVNGSLRIGSDTRLVVHPRAVIQLVDNAGVDASIFLITNKDHEHGNTNLIIEGGIWDGNNPGNRRGEDAPDSYTGVAINFINVNGLELRRMTVRDPESYYIRMGEVNFFRVEDIRFEARHFRPNQDGIHITGFSEDGLIRNVVAVDEGTTRDDLIALNADDATQRAQNLGTKCGPIRRIRIENLSAQNCHSFVRFLSVWSPIEDIEIHNVQGGCRVSVLNFDACRGCRVQVFDSDDPGASRGVGLIRNVTISGVRAYKSEERDSPLLLLETRMECFVLRDFERIGEKDKSPAAPTLRIAHLVSDDIVLEGLRGSDITQLVNQSDAVDFHVSHLPMIYPEAQRYRLIANLEPNSQMLSHLRRLDHLAINRSDMSMWPEQVNDSCRTE